MINILRSTITACLLIALSGCAIDLSGEETTDADDALDDAAKQDISAELFSDGLIPPTAPELTIGAALGTLQFSWVNTDDSGEPVTSTTLYQYDARTGIETELDANKDTNLANYELSISPHQLAWDTLSYRVEICTSINCLSSLRMPIDTLLADTLEVVQPSNADLFPGYGSHLALNATGNVALVANPQGNNATVLIRPAHEWILASSLTPSHIDQTADAEFRVAVSTSGDTMAVAFVSDDSHPQVAIFDRLGEAWIETGTIEPFAGNQLSDLTRAWDTQSLHITLSGNGDRLAIGAQQLNQSSRAGDRKDDNQITIFERGALNWSQTTTLSVPNLHLRLRSFSSSTELDSLVALSAANGALYLNEYRLTNNIWQTSATQLLNNVAPAIDANIVSSSNGTVAVIASWETDSNGTRAPVAWKLERRTAAWIAIDSVRQAVTANTTAQLRLAADALLNNMALGWQAKSNANLIFYSEHDAQWQALFGFPRALSVAFSAGNETALVGATGGFFSFAPNE